MKTLEERISQSASIRLDRREFIKKTSAAALALSLPLSHELLKDKRMGVVVHSYGSRWNSKIESRAHPRFTNAIELLEHCHAIDAGGIQVGIRGWTTDFVKKIRDRREKLGLYLEGSLGTPQSEDELAQFEQDIKGAKEAGANIVRTVCSSGRRYEVYHSAEEFQNARASAMKSLQLVEPVLRKHGVKLAIENHKDWRATELAEMIKKIGSEWIGVTLDFGNSISLMEDPEEVAETLAPYAFTTHVKDMGLDEYPYGFLLSEVPLGQGMVDLSRIISLCSKHNPSITFNLEMITRDPLKIPCLTDDYWATFGGIPGSELARTLRMVREHKFSPTLPTVSQLNDEERLTVEEENIIISFDYSKTKLGLI